MNLIAGLDHPTSGTISIEGQNLATLESNELAQYRRHTVGMVFQSFNLVSTMTLTENVELPMRFAEVERRERDARVQEALSQVGLSGRLEHRPSEMSGGEQQRAALARALVNRPKLLLADEPTGNLDSKTGTEILDLIRELNKTLGMTVIMVTHERALADRYADRLIFLGDGKLINETVNVAGGAR
jgi:putative ABC transport system ATP-binding protein